MMDNIYENSILKNGYVIKTDKRGKIIYANSNYLKMTGYEADELLYNHYNEFICEDEQQNITQEISSNKEWKGVIKNYCKDGECFYIDTHVNTVFDKQGRIQEILAFGHDVSEYINVLKYDKLTKLKNRDALSKTIDSSKEYAIALVNLDNFSEINEFYGGYVGDQVIIQASHRLIKAFGKSDVYRLQGDEFAVLKELNDRLGKDFIIDSVRNRLKSIFEESMKLEDVELPITATVGMHVGADNLLRNANIAYRNSKEKNFNFTLYTEDMYYKYADFSHNKKMANSIKAAIKEDLVKPYYQPIIDNKTEEVTKYEALARLRQQENLNDVMNPAAFLDISKRIKYYHKITRSMIYKSFNDFRRVDGYALSINITLDDIANTRTFAFIVEQLRQNKNNEYITFEIVESEGIEDFELFDKFVKTIKKFGAKISIDDFGTGYSNFWYLAKLEPDFLKIDGSLIQNITNQKDYDVVKTIVGFAKMYNIKTVAEFVENEEIFKLVKQLEIDYSQGYYFGKPVPFEQIQA